MCHFCHVLRKNPTAPEHHSKSCLDRKNQYSQVPMHKRKYENGNHISKLNTNATSLPKTTASAKPTSAEPNNCSICLDNEPNMAFIPCGHIAVCEACASQVDDCPICRQAITTKQKIYRV